jgi:outer membrane protein OmpA-like peptidoglycan-associated protein
MSTAIIVRASAAKLAGVTLLALLVAACAGAPVAPEGAAAARAELTRLQSDPTLAPLAPVAVKAAEDAVKAAEETGLEDEVGAHRVYIANRKIETARALAEARRAEDQRKELLAQRDQARLEARTQEAQAARMAAAGAQQETAELRREIEELRARPTDRGLVLTLGDVLFATGRAELKTGSILELNQLVAFLRKYPERTVIIEGHTDSVGSEDFNVGLSQRRADSVRSYLVRQGVDPSRITTTGMGESVPVASNDTAAGRQQNRRVEIIISNAPRAAM